MVCLVNDLLQREWRIDQLRSNDEKRMEHLKQKLLVCNLWMCVCTIHDPVLGIVNRRCDGRIDVMINQVNMFAHPMHLSL